MRKWKKKSKVYRFNPPLDLATRQFIEYFGLFIKQCYHIAWSTEKIQEAKIQNL